MRYDEQHPAGTSQNQNGYQIKKEEKEEEKVKDELNVYNNKEVYDINKVIIKKKDLN